MKKYYIAYNGEIDEDFAYDTYEDAKSALSEAVRDACREDAQQGCYSRGREAYYWAITKVVAIEE